MCLFPWLQYDGEEEEEGAEEGEYDEDADADYVPGVSCHLWPFVVIWPFDSLVARVMGHYG